jgi:hypothetical protein
MGSRYLPTECEHGVTVDDGDFGPCQDCDEHGDDPCPNFHQCPKCDADRAAERAVEQAELAVIEAAIEWRKHVSLAGPPKFPKPTYSTLLADTIDNLRRLQ